MTLTPYEIAAEMYNGVNILHIMKYCAENGVVISNSECFICAYKTHHSFIKTKSKELIETKYQKGVDNPDTWYVYVASGSIKSLMKHMEPMKFAAWYFSLFESFQK